MSNFMKKMFLKQRAEFEKEEEKQNAGFVLPPTVTLTENVPYMADGAAAHRMDIYQPGDPAQNRAVIINVHGGGLLEGSKEFNRRFCVQLCGLGFLVFAIEYPLVPDVSTFQQMESVSRAMDAVGALLPRYGGNPGQLYMVGDSAGAYLITYAAAMQRSPELAKAAGVQPSSLEVQALGLISGMFYTCRRDKIGLFLPNYLYGKGYRKTSFFPFTNPEHPDVAGKLLPSFLVTSKNDMLQSYTLDFAKALERHSVPHRLLDLPADPRLTHAFSVFAPELPESGTVIREMCAFLLQYKK